MSKYKHITIGYKCQDSKGNKGVVAEEYGHYCSVKFEDGAVRVKIPKNKIDSCSFRKELPEKLAKINIPLGTKYGNLSVVGYDGAKLVADCMCGNRVTTTRTSVMKLGKISCGCLAAEGTEKCFWDDFNLWMSDWNPNTHRTDTKKIPLFRYRRG